MSFAIDRYSPHNAAVAETNTNPHKAAVGHDDSASPLQTYSQPPVAVMNNNFKPWAQPFTPSYGYYGQSIDQNYNRDRNRTRNRNRDCDRNQWQAPAQGYMPTAPIASLPWNTVYAQSQQQQHDPNGLPMHNNFGSQQAQAQSYYYPWAQYYGHTEGVTSTNASLQMPGQQAPRNYPFFAPSFAAMPPHPELHSVSNEDLQYAFGSLYKSTRSKTRKTNVNRRASAPLSDEPIQVVTGTHVKAKKYNSLDRVSPDFRINKLYRAPVAYPTTKPTGRSKEPKIMLPPPTPTEAYMAQAAEDPSTVELSGRILVILDLNGTLLYRPNRNKKTMIARPFLIPFLRYLFSNFAVMVWSSARPENVASLVEQSLEENLKRTLVAQWGRDAFGLKPEHYSQNVQVYKNLNLVWSKDEIQRQHPNYANGGRFGQHNTVLIDDSTLKAAAQPYNLLKISEFNATPQQMQEDKLREVAGYLEVLRTQQDVSKFMKKECFRHSTGRWLYEWPEMDAAVEGTAFQGDELQGKVSMDADSKKEKKNKKAKKREKAIKMQASKGGKAGRSIGMEEQAEDSEASGEADKSDGGVRLA